MKEVIWRIHEKTMEGRAVKREGTTKKDESDRMSA
jgi:hypothetical protein